jgi:hypothetical protein
MLRAAGGVDRKKLLSFLDTHAATMPRTLLRYSIEHLDKKQRDLYLSMKKGGNKPATKSHELKASSKKRGRLKR